MKVPRKAATKEFCRRVTFWYGLVGSSRLGTAGSRFGRKSISKTLFDEMRCDMSVLRAA